MFKPMQFIADLALGWFIYTAEGRKMAKKAIDEIGKNVNREISEFWKTNTTGENKNDKNIERSVS